MSTSSSSISAAARALGRRRWAGTTPKQRVEFAMKGVDARRRLRAETAQESAS